MPEFSDFDAPTGQVPVHPDRVPASQAPSSPTLPPPPEQPAVSSSGHREPVEAAQPAVPSPGREKPKRPLPIRLVIWAVVILALVAAAVFGKEYWDSSREPTSVPASEQIEVTVGSPTQVPSTVAESAQVAPTTAGPTVASSPVCVELQQVQAMSNEVSSILSDVGQEISASPGGMDETAILTRFREAADLMELSLPDLLAAYESAAQVAPAEVATDLRAVAAGTALLTPTVIEVMRNARAVEDITGLEQALQSPELANAAIEAGTASLRLDGYTIPSCGFKFSN